VTPESSPRALAGLYNCHMSAINLLFSNHPKCLDLIVVCFSGPMISIENLRLMSHASAGDRSRLQKGYLDNHIKGT